MDSLDPKDLLVAYLTALFDRRDVEAAARYLAPEFKVHALDGRPISDLATAKQFFRAMLNAFPDANVTIDQILAEGNDIAARLTFEGTQRALFLDVPATGRPVSLSITVFYRMTGGRFTDAWSLWDLASMWRQLGVAPPGFPAGARLPASR